MSDLIRGQKPLGVARRRWLAERDVTVSDGPADVQPPTNPAQLRQFIQRWFGLEVPQRRLCPHHHSPMDYIAASFFGQDDLLVWANRGGGKTMLAAVSTILDAIFRYPLRICVLGGSFDQSDRLADYIRDILSCHPRLLTAVPTRQRMCFYGGSEIRVLTQSQRAVRGQHVQKIRCDEVDLFDVDIWRALQFATQSQRGARGSIEVLSTLHRAGGLMQSLVDEAAAPDGDTDGGYKLIKWCLWEVIERCGESRRCEDCLLADDCGGIAREADGFFKIDDAISIKARSSRAAWDAEMLCLGPQREWLVFGEFEPPKHVGEVEYCGDWPLYRAIDFGYRSPLVCLWIQVTPAGRVHVLQEYVRRQLPVTRHAANILERDPGEVVMTYVDPAGKQRESTSGAACTEILAAQGIPCVWRPSGIMEGLELVRMALAPAVGEPALTIHPRCIKLIEAFNSYHYPPPGSAAAGTSPDKPVKDGPDHLIDALRYFFINRKRPRIAIERARY